MDTRDYYKILEIDPLADAGAIKKAYKKLAIKYHPDRNPDDASASEKMAMLNEAYAVLSNSDKRREYDHLRERFGTDAAGRFRQSNSYEDILKHSDIEKIFQEIADSFGIRGLNELFKVSGGVNSGGFFFFGTFGPRSDAQGFNSRGFSEINNQSSTPQLKPYQKFFYNMGNKLLKRAVNSLLKAPETELDVYDNIVLSPSHARDGGPYAYYHKKRDARLVVKIPPDIKDGHKIRLKGAGIEDSLTGQKGDLFLTVAVKNDLLSRIKGFISKN
ncbi:putative DnaJ3 [Desulfamplus magnetovallimortis]|uniref:Putative DnaJ3 n=1 Tax=Desulfamplus magnetovallimortis TaxID=1246637 RepID=A0A1W1HII5_9BACT|nr:DnaJ domain-containing protein [Desulfamplus magnetovallimortis]SLM32311.1 putative DnaJ3 [Desulfamplus magnetovallimortis]